MFVCLFNFHTNETIGWIFYSFTLSLFLKAFLWIFQHSIFQIIPTSFHVWIWPVQFVRSLQGRFQTIYPLKVKKKPGEKKTTSFTSWHVDRSLNLCQVVSLILACFWWILVTFQMANNLWPKFMRVPWNLLFLLYSNPTFKHCVIKSVVNLILGYPLYQHLRSQWYKTLYFPEILWCARWQDEDA